VANRGEYRGVAACVRCNNSTWRILRVYRAIRLRTVYTHARSGRGIAVASCRRNCCPVLLQYCGHILRLISIGLTFFVIKNTRFNGLFDIATLRIAPPSHSAANKTLCQITVLAHGVPFHGDISTSVVVPRVRTLLPDFLLFAHFCGVPFSSRAYGCVTVRDAQAVWHERGALRCTCAVSLPPHLPPRTTLTAPACVPRVFCGAGIAPPHYRCTI